MQYLWRVHIEQTWSSLSLSFSQPPIVLSSIPPEKATSLQRKIIRQKQLSWGCRGKQLLFRHRFWGTLAFLFFFFSAQPRLPPSLVFSPGSFVKPLRDGHGNAPVSVLCGVWLWVVVLVKPRRRGVGLVLLSRQPQPEVVASGRWHGSGRLGCTLVPEKNKKKGGLGGVAWQVSSGWRSLALRLASLLAFRGCFVSFWLVWLCSLQLRFHLPCCCLMFLLLSSL